MAKAMNGAFNLNLQGRWGNTLFQVAFALAYCIRHDLELRIEGNWVGEEIFGLKLGRFQERFRDRRRNEETLDPNGETDVEFTGYCQNQKSLIYTRSEVREWFSIRADLRAIMDTIQTPIITPFVAHVRRGDFEGYGFPVITEAAFTRFVEKQWPDGAPVIDFVSEEKPFLIPELPDNIAFLFDFYRLMRAERLLRANSSFSWWAATLGSHVSVHSPIIETLEGGIEHDRVEFVPGNWTRLSTHTFCTDLHLKP